MRLLGIDYGTKKLGLALGSTDTRLAQPYAVIPADTRAVKAVAAVCRREAVEKIVIGRSIDYNRTTNPADKAAAAFGRKLAEVAGLPIAWIDETLTTKAAERIAGRDKQTDARAAALILDNFLHQAHD